MRRRSAGPRLLAWAGALSGLGLGLGLALTAPARAELVCPHDTPKSGQWRVVRGFGAGPTQGEAIRAAEVGARTALREQVEGAFDETGLQVLLAGLNFTLYPNEYDAKTGEACVLGIVADTNLGASQRAHVAQLEAQLDTVAEALKTQLKPRDTLRVEVPLWPGFWARGEPARDLRNRLLGKLAGARLTEHRPTRILTGEVTASGAECRWVPLLHDPRAKAQRTLGAVVFNPQALGLTSCAAPVATGGGFPLPRARTGQDGLQVTLTTSVSTATPCGGEPFSIQVQSNQAARVRLYSVASNGLLMLLGPEMTLAADTPMAITSDANPARHVLLKQGVVSMLFAVAVPKDMAFPPLGADQPGCLGHTGWDSGARLPAQAAIDGVPVSVRPPQAPGCPLNPEHLSWHNRLLTSIDAMPACEK